MEFSFISRLARHWSNFIISYWPIQILIFLFGLGLFILGALCAAFYIRIGLDWSFLIPSQTIEHAFVQISNCKFGMINFQIITRGSDLPGPRPNHLVMSNPVSKFWRLFGQNENNLAIQGRGLDFPIQQRKLRWMYDQLANIPGVILWGNRNPLIWLDAMRNWLIEAQKAFDLDRSKGSIFDTGHWTSNATWLGILGLQLIVQTDRGPELGRVRR